MRHQCFIAMVGLLLIPAIQADAANQVADLPVASVTTQAGETYRGVVDDRTDNDQLWIRLQRGGTLILRPIAWETISRVNYQGQSHDADAFRQLALQVATPAAPQRLVDRATEQTSTKSTSPQAIQASRMLGFSHSPTTFRASASLSDWDADVENDGLVVRIQISDEHGHLSAFDGALEANLNGFHSRTFDAVPHGRGQTAEQIGRWRISISAEDFQNGQLIVRLPFRRDNPELDTEWAARAMLQLRLVLPGHGTFDKTIDSVRVRS